jgi:small subunit ribosomal protein S20
MPIIASAKKRVRTAQKAAIRNSKTKRNFKTAIKSFYSELKNGGKKANEELVKAQSALDTAAKKGVIHKNKAARKKQQLTRDAKAANVKPATAAKKATSTATKTAKKAAPKKPAAKKAPAKKPATKTKK